MFYGEKACHINPIKLPGVLHFMKGGEVCEGGGRGGGAGGGGGQGGGGVGGAEIVNQPLQNTFRGSNSTFFASLFSFSVGINF